MGKWESKLVWDGIPDNLAGLPDKKQLIAAWYMISELFGGMQSLEICSQKKSQRDF